MISSYRKQDWDRVEELLAECRKLEPALGKLYDLYEGRMKAYRAQPPGDNWDGVFTATTK